MNMGWTIGHRLSASANTQRSGIHLFFPRLEKVKRSRDRQLRPRIDYGGTYCADSTVRDASIIGRKE